MTTSTAVKTLLNKDRLREISSAWLEYIHQDYRKIIAQIIEMEEVRSDNLGSFLRLQENLCLCVIKQLRLWTHGHNDETRRIAELMTLMCTVLLEQVEEEDSRLRLLLNCMAQKCAWMEWVAYYLAFMSVLAARVEMKPE